MNSHGLTFVVDPVDLPTVGMVLQEYSRNPDRGPEALTVSITGLKAVDAARVEQALRHYRIIKSKEPL